MYDSLTENVWAGFLQEEGEGGSCVCGCAVFKKLPCGLFLAGAPPVVHLP